MNRVAVDEQLDEGGEVARLEVDTFPVGIQANCHRRRWSWPERPRAARVPARAKE